MPIVTISKGEGGMLLKLIKFELKYHSRQLSFWLALIMFTLLGYLLSGRQVHSGNIVALSPQNLTYALTFFSQIAIFTTTLITASALLRDKQFQFNELVLVTPINKTLLSVSRFLGLFFMNLLIVLVAVIALVLPVTIGSYDPELVGEFQFSYILWPFLIITLPNLFFNVALLFASANIFNSTIMTFVSGVLIYVIYLLSASLLDSPMFVASDAIARDEIAYASLLDPFAVSAFLEQTQYWTSEQKNSTLVRLEDNLLYNRLIWLCLSIAIMLWALMPPLSFLRKNKVKSNTANHSEQTVKANYAAVTPRLNNWSGLKAEILLELKMTFRGLPFILLMGLLSFLLVAYLINGMNNHPFVGEQYPYTGSILPHLTKPIELITMLVIVFFSGEMIWRSHERNFQHVLGATPVAKWVFLVAKAIVMALIILLVSVIAIAVAIAFQLVSGFHAENMYLFLYVLPLFAWPMLLMALVCLSVQLLSANQYTGFIVSGSLILFFNTDIALLFGIEHNLLRFANTGSRYFSDFSGFDFYITNTFWFSLYWTLFTIVVLIIAYGISKRALVESNLSAIKRFPQLLSKSGIRLLKVSVVGLVICGGYVFYNTNMLNTYQSQAELIEHKVNYEQQLQGFKRSTAPKITDIKLNVDFYPSMLTVKVAGSYQLKNQSTETINHFLLSLPNGQQTFSFKLNEPHTSVRKPSLNVIEVELQTPLKPNETLTLEFVTELAKQGFKNTDADISLLTNGSYFHGSHILPFVGYNQAFEITNSKVRAEYGLSPRQTLEVLEKGKKYHQHGHEQDASWINFEAIVSTEKGQTTFAPGELQASWSTVDRDYYHYKVSNPISNFLGFASGNYQTQSRVENGITISAHYHPSHNKNIEKLLDTAARSLAYYQNEFGPYPYPSLNLVEIPNRGFGRAYPGLIYISEHVGYKENLNSKNNKDDFSYLIAHEIAHQWWGHQLAAAKTEGEVFLIESLADYSALIVMKEIYGESYVDSFMAKANQKYLQGRAQDLLGEVPLYRLLGQRYLRYQKGPIVLNAIRHKMGEKALNKSLKSLLSNKGNIQADYATTLDFISEIKTNSNESQHDLFEQWLTLIQVYDLKISNSNVELGRNGKYKITANIEAHSELFNTINSRIDPVSEQFVDLVYYDLTAATTKEVLNSKVEVIDGKGSISFETENRHGLLVIDPHYMFIDKNRANNQHRF